MWIGVGMTEVYKALYDDVGIRGVAYAEVKEARAFQLPDSGIVERWQPFVLRLRKGDLADYLSSNLGCRLCSDRLKAILGKCAAPIDELQWLPVDVRRLDESHPYWILHFPSPPDVLDRNATIFAAGFVAKPVLSKDAVKGHHVFSHPGDGGLRLFVERSVTKAFKAAKLKGIKWSRAAIR